MRKKLTLMFVALFSIAAFAATHVLNQLLSEQTTPVFADNAIVYDFEAEQALIAAGIVSKPGNVGGNQNNGQGFYGWENSGKTDSKRNDYKGYKLAEGSQLPEENHVWRRADRYDQDASWANAGGLTCPNDREYAIDGLDAGAVVTIIYDATKAAEDKKEILWAMGDGSSESLASRATATIDGVEAVSGTTAIPSGATIEVKSVTPAVKGTGYIVIKVFKNMVIKQIAIEPAPVLTSKYDFEAEQALIAAGIVSKPGNVGGNQNNGQGFYGWENSGKTDSKRNDYKGYKLAEGSQLPADNHVWRRADRYDQDASWANAGGLTCPNDREYAIDGLKKGSKVVIEYDATNAAEDKKEILWAMGDGSSEGLASRATATIDGVEAISGTTTIPSGATIEVKSVTPAVKGTGYIVVKVFKNMIIKKISIFDGLVQYKVNVGEIENGKVSVDKQVAEEGDVITITATPNEKYDLESITVIDANGNMVAVNGNSFIMPASNVTVSATFVLGIVDMGATTAAIDVTVPANLGNMDGTDGPTDLALFLDSYLESSPNPAYIKLTLVPGGEYCISKPLETISAIQIMGDESMPATIDASALGTDVFVKVSDTKVSGEPNDKGFYANIYNVEFKNFTLDKAKGSLFCSNGQKYVVPNMTIDNVIYSGRDNLESKSIIDFAGGGVVENLAITRSTIFGSGKLFDANGGSKLADAGVNGQTFTLSYNTLAFVGQLAHADNSESAMRTITVDHNVILEQQAGFVTGLNAGDANCVVQYNAFQKYEGYTVSWVDISDDEDAAGAAGSIKGNMVWVDTVKFIQDILLNVTNFPMGDCPQRDAKIGDPRWLSAKMRVHPSDIDDEGDLAKVINEGVKKGYSEFELVQNEYGNLRYTVKQSIVADRALVITGKNVQIDVAHNDPFILLSKTPAVGFIQKTSTIEPAAAPAQNRAAAEPEYSDYYGIDQIKLEGLTIVGVKNSIIYDNNTKYCVVNLAIDNCVLDLETEKVSNEALIAFQAGGVKDFAITNSTVYGNNAVAKYFIRYNNSARIDRFGFDKADDTWSFTYANNTFYGLLKSDGQWGNYSGIVGKNAQGIVTVKNNIWYNCDAQTMRRLLHSKNFSTFNAASTMEKNTFWYNGGAVDQGNYGNGSDLASDPGFLKPAEGNFTLSAYSEQAQEKTGDPRWYAEGGHYNPTAIDAVKNPEAVDLDNAVIYNLNGQRVEKAQKGIYIVNGKKIFFK